jgi:hypothetical protein
MNFDLLSIILLNQLKSIKTIKSIKSFIIYQNTYKYGLDSRTYSKLIEVSYSDVNFEEYRRIVDSIGP